MRACLIGFAFVFLSSGNLFAADALNSEIDPARFHWQGAYVGLSGGYAWLKDVDNAFVPPLHDEGRNWNFGAHGGYLGQFGSFVAGAEFEVNQLNIDYEFLSFITVERSFVVKARAGYAFDRFLVTAHAGGVYAQTNFMGLEDWGWEAGAGVDYALTDNITIGGQYAHYRFNDFDGTQIDAKVDLVSARLGYKF